MHAADRSGIDWNPQSPGRLSARQERPMLITSQIEYQTTMLLIQEMSGALEDTLEERLLVRLVLSVEIWGAKQPEIRQ